MTKKFEDLTPDERMNYAKDEPEAFNQLAEQAIEDFILSAPAHKQLKLRAIQAKINKELSKYKHPVARLNRMQELFWNQVREFQQSLNDL